MPVRYILDTWKKVLKMGSTTMEQLPYDIRLEGAGDMIKINYSIDYVVSATETRKVDIEFLISRADFNKLAQPLQYG